MLRHMTRTMMAFAVVALLTHGARGQQPRTLDDYLNSSGSQVSNSRGQKVRIVRGQAEAAQPEVRELFSGADPSAPPEPEPESIDGNWDSSWDGSGYVGGEGCGLDGNCGNCCNDCGMMNCCCTPYWAHRTHVFGEYLYLLPSDVDMAYAFQQNGTGGLGTVPAGSVGVLQPDFQSAYRAGGGVALGCYASINASYMRFDSHTTSSLSAPQGVGGNVQSLVLHPNSLNAGSTASLVDSALDLSYQLADIEYRRLLRWDYQSALNYSVGARYGKLGQGFSQLGDFAPPTGTISTTSDITFEGVGLRGGLDAERRLGCSRFAGYGKIGLSMLFGDVRAAYQQFNETTTEVQAFSSWRDQRVVPLLEYEVGLNWTSRRGRWRASIGYYTNFWFNTVTTGQFVQASQFADFVDLGETISFTGLVSRIEFRR